MIRNDTVWGLITKVLIRMRKSTDWYVPFVVWHTKKTDFLAFRPNHILSWASTRETLSSEGCEQQRRRPACTSAQSDQRLCFSLFGKYPIQTCYERNFKFPANLCSRAGWFESHFVGNPKDRFSRVAARLLILSFNRI